MGLLLSALALLTAWPGAVVIAVLALRPWMDLLWWHPGVEVHGALPGLVPIPRLVGVASLVLLLAAMTRSAPRLRAAPLLSALALLGLIGLALLRAPEGGLYIGNAARMVSGLVVLLAGGAAAPRPWRLLGAITIAGLVPLALALRDLAAGQMDFLEYRGYHRLAGPYDVLERHAFLQLGECALLLLWTVRLRGALRWLCGLAAAAAAVCLFLTQIRGAMLGLLVFGVLFVALARVPRPVALGALAAGAMGLLVLIGRLGALALLWASDPPLDRWLEIGSGRLLMWWMSLQEYAIRPAQDLVSGLGIGGQWELMAGYTERFHKWTEVTGPHSTPLALLYQAGPLALVAALALLTRLFTASAGLVRRGDPDSADLGAFGVALTAATLTCSLFLDMSQFLTPVWLLAATAGLVFSRYSSR